MTTDSDTKDMGPFYAALGKAQGEMGSGVGKDAKNPHFKSQYATLSACLAVAMPALARHGFALIQYREGSDLVTRLGHSSGAELITLYPLEPSKKTEQGWGSAITYARRYQVMALLGLAPEDDDGNAASQRGPAGAAKERPATNSRSAEDWVPAAAKAMACELANLKDSTIEGFVFDGSPPVSVSKYFEAEAIRERGRDDAKAMLRTLREAVKQERTGL